MFGDEPHSDPAMRKNDGNGNQRDDPGVFRCHPALLVHRNWQGAAVVFVVLQSSPQFVSA